MATWVNRFGKFINTYDDLGNLIYEAFNPDYNASTSLDNWEVLKHAYNSYGKRTKTIGPLEGSVDNQEALRWDESSFELPQARENIDITFMCYALSAKFDQLINLGKKIEYHLSTLSGVDLENEEI